jgi:hypothetical protein
MKRSLKGRWEKVEMKWSLTDLGLVGELKIAVEQRLKLGISVGEPKVVWWLQLKLWISPLNFGRNSWGLECICLSLAFSKKNVTFQRGTFSGKVLSK